MMQMVTYIILICLLTCCTNGNQSTNRATQTMAIQDTLRTEFEYHFKILDSAAKRSVSDSVHCCGQSIKFMEINTAIDAHSDGTYVGKLFFLKEDLRNWHEWYNKKKS